MKNLITTLFLSILIIPLSIFSEPKYEIAVIDSFQWTDTQGYGVGDADAAEYNGKIFLSYFYYPNASNNRYVICAEKINAGFLFDTLATFVADGWLHRTATAVQIDNMYNPWVYYLYDGNIWSSRKINGVWITDQIVTNSSPTTDGMTTIDGAGEKIGLFRLEDEGNSKYAVKFTYWNNNRWNTDVIYESDWWWRATATSAVSVGNDLYVSFVTVSGSPDSIAVHVMKEDKGTWTEDFRDVVVTQLGGAYISEKGMLGKSQNGKVFLWRYYAQSDLGENEGTRVFEKTTSGWQKIQLNSPPNGFVAMPRCSNLAVTNSEIVCAVSEGNGFDPKLSWAKTDGVSGLDENLPNWYWSPFTIWVYDIINVNDDVYIYYTNGAAGNYNYPVTFKQAKINVNDLITGVKDDGSSVPNKFELYQNYPNPFNPSTTIRFGLPEQGLVNLCVYNILGQEVATLVNKELSAGYHTVNFGNDNLATGLYIYILKVGGKFTSVKKMLLVK